MVIESVLLLTFISCIVIWLVWRRFYRPKKRRAKYYFMVSNDVNLVRAMARKLGIAGHLIYPVDNVIDQYSHDTWTNFTAKERAAKLKHIHRQLTYVIDRLTDEPIVFWSPGYGRYNDFADLFNPLGDSTLCREDCSIYTCLTQLPHLSTLLSYNSEAVWVDVPQSDNPGAKMMVKLRNKGELLVSNHIQFFNERYEPVSQA